MKSFRACAFILCLVQQVSGQGTFQNLNFEQAAGHVAPTPVGGFGDFVDPALAFPGWTIGTNTDGSYPTVTFYNDLSIGASAVGLMGPNFPNGPGYLPLQGSYSVLLQFFGLAPALDPPRLSQTGQVPVGARSINFLVLASQSDITVSLGGVNIPVVSISGGRLAGDVTAFAGSNVQLTFSTTTPTIAGAGAWAYFDDIRFSTTPVPEPSVLGLVAAGFVLSGGRRRVPRG